MDELGVAKGLVFFFVFAVKPQFPVLHRLSKARQFPYLNPDNKLESEKQNFQFLGLKAKKSEFQTKKYPHLACDIRLHVVKHLFLPRVEHCHAIPFRLHGAPTSGVATGSAPSLFIIFQL